MNVRDALYDWEHPRRPSEAAWNFWKPRGPRQGRPGISGGSLATVRDALDDLGDLRRPSEAVCNFWKPSGRPHDSFLTRKLCFRKYFSRVYTHGPTVPEGTIAV